MKKVLIFGDVDSIWVRDFAIKVIHQLNYETYVFCESGDCGKFQNDYSDNGVYLIKGKLCHSFVKKLPFIRRLVSLMEFKRFVKKQDFYAIIGLYVTPYVLRLLSPKCFDHIKRYALFIGSDILRADNKKCSKMKMMFQRTSIKPVFDSKKLYIEFAKRIKSLASPCIIYFGTGQLSHIDAVYNSGVEAAKEAFGISEEKLVFCIGYNAIPSQQHLKVIDSINKVSGDLLEKAVFLFPMAYGGSKEYIEQVRQKLEESKLSAMILTSFLGPKEIAQLRVATDFFINSQTTDDLSASLIESLYAGSNVVNAEWLEYPDLEENNIRFYKLFNFNTLNKVVEESIQSKFCRIRVDLAKIEKFVSWDRCMIEWKTELERN